MIPPHSPFSGDAVVDKFAFVLLFIFIHQRQAAS